MGEFDGKTAIVTGAGGDLGREIVARLARGGASVLAVDLGQAGVDAAVAAAEAEGGTARGITANVTDADSTAAYAAAGAELGGGGVDLFVNNAGIGGPVGPLLDYPDEGFDAVMAVNVRGVYLGLKHVGRVLRDGGAIVNSASTAGVTGAPNFGAYVASKHAVIGLTKSAALELAPRGIRVNAVCPGPIESRMMDEKEAGSGVDRAKDRITEGIPLGRYGRIPEVAAMVAFLLSDDAAYATGAAYLLDGGLTAA
jgi:NAD(P)-dependent dehydrogenase (short-subunit alcohol dehydrogenase family)